MTTLYLDCTHGAKKDTFAMCIGMLLPREERERVDSAVGILAVLDAPEDAHAHHSFDEVRKKICAKPLSSAVVEAALGVYGILAQAEAQAHGVPVEDVHFHEVGSDAAITWICAACGYLDALAPDDIIASQVCTGFGFVDCAHGRLPIPAPATANILQDVPTFEGDVEGELTTPTGAALVRYFARTFVDAEPAGCELSAQVGSW